MRKVVVYCAMLLLLLHPGVTVMAADNNLPNYKNLRTIHSSEVLQAIDRLSEMGRLQDAASLYECFDCLTVDESVMRHSDRIIEKMRHAGMRIIGTTDPNRKPKENELIVVYGNYHHGHNNLPYSNKIWRHPLYFNNLVHTSVEYAPAWESIGQIYILGLEERKDRYQEILAELCRMQAPLDRIYHYVAQRETVTGNKMIDIYAGATKNHGDVAEHFLNSSHLHCLVLEDDVTFSADWQGNLERLQLFFEREYDYEVCLLNSSKYHEIREHDDLLLRSYQECTTTSAYLLSRSGAAKALFYFRDGYEKILASQNTYYVCDRYWAEMQKGNKFFLFRTKFGYQRCNYSSITGQVDCHFD